MVRVLMHCVLLPPYTRVVVAIFFLMASLAYILGELLAFPEFSVMFMKGLALSR